MGVLSDIADKGSMAQHRGPHRAFLDQEHHLRRQMLGFSQDLLNQKLGGGPRALRSLQVILRHL